MRKSDFILLVLLLILPLGRTGAQESQDKLLIVISGNQAENVGLELYDPTTNTSTTLLDNYLDNRSLYSNPILSLDGRLAFSASFEGRMTAHILDTNHLDQPVEM